MADPLCPGFMPNFFVGRVRDGCSELLCVQGLLANAYPRQCELHAARNVYTVVNIQNNRSEEISPNTTATLALLCPAPTCSPQPGPKPVVKHVLLDARLLVQPYTWPSNLLLT